MADFTKEDILYRKTQRNKIQDLYIQAVNAKNIGLATKLRNTLEGDLEVTFEELPYVDDYISDLRSLYKSQNKVDYQGSDANLVNESFDQFNAIEQNLGATMADLANGGMFEEYSAEDLVKLGNVYEYYSNTDAFGDGSRPFTDQAGNLVINTLKDPTTYLSGGVGAFITKYVGKSAAKLAIKDQIKKAIALKTGVMGTGGIYGASADTARQNMEMDLGVRDEFSPEELAISTVVGTALPVVTQKVGQLLGWAQRSTTHPIKSWHANKESGRQAGLLHTQSEAEKIINMQGASKTSGSERLSDSISGLVAQTKKSITDGFSNLKYNPIPIHTIEKTFNQLKTIRGIEIPKSMQAIIDDLQPVRGNLFGSKVPSDLTPQAALQQLRQEAYSMSQALTKEGKNRESKIMMDFYYKFRSIQGDHAVDKKAFNNLFDANKSLEKMLNNTSMGKKFKFMFEAESPSDKAIAAEKLIKTLTTGDGALLHLKNFKSSLGEVDRIVKASSGVEQNSYKSFLSSVREGMGGFLVGDKNTQQLAKLLDKHHGFTILKEIYPDDVKFFSSLEKLKNLISGPNKRDTSSVIVNMTFARVGAEVGQRTAGKSGSVVGTIGTMMGLGHFRQLIDNPNFRKVMADTINNNGRIPTASSNLMKKMGYTDTQVRGFVDQINALMVTSPLLKGNIETYKEIQTKVMH